MWWDRVQPTSQLVAVRGTRENSQPSREGLSEASRMYLSVRIIVSPPKSHQRLCMSESRYGCVRCQGMFGWGWCWAWPAEDMRLTGSRLCVRSEMALISGSSLNPPDRAQAPVQLPASKHRLVHGLAANMVAHQESTGAEERVAPRLRCSGWGKQ